MRPLMRRLLPELSTLAFVAVALAFVAASSSGSLARAATTSPSMAAPIADDAGAVNPAVDLARPARPSASLLFAQPPHEVAFVLDGPSNPAFPLLLGFRDAS